MGNSLSLFFRGIFDGPLHLQILDEDIVTTIRGVIENNNIDSNFQLTGTPQTFTYRDFLCNALQRSLDGC